MKAVVFYQHGGIEVLKLEDVPKPEVGPEEALVRVRACGVNHLDLWVRQGTLAAKIPLPHISGCEVAGEVVTLGSQADGITMAQRVAVAPYLHCGRCEYCLIGEETICIRSDVLGMVSDGGFAEYVKVPIRSLAPLPKGLSYEDAAAVTLSTLTAWHMLVTRARVKAGEDVLVLAAGSGIGSAAIQIAKLCGARVITTASSEDKLAKARELGADEVINYKEKDFRDEVRRITNRRGVDVVVEHVGVDTWEKSIGSLTRNGRLVTCGATTGRAGTTDLWRLFSTQVTLIGAYGGTRRELVQVLELTAQGRLRPVIHKTFPLEGVAEAQRVMEERQQFGKLVIVP